MSQPETAPQSSSLSFLRTLAFAATSAPISALLLAISVYMPAYFAASVGVPLTAVAAAFATCRMIDLPIEPALGLLMDRTRSPWGRYRLWLLLGTPFLMGGLLMLLNARAGVGAGYLIVWLLVMYLGLSILTLAHAAWAATLARSYEQRARLFGFVGAMSVVGTLGVLIIPIQMARIGYSDAEGVRAMLWFIIVSAPVAALIVSALTPETLALEAPGQKFRMHDYVELVTRPTMVRLLIADLCLTMGPGWMAATFLFFSRDRMGLTTTGTNLLLFVLLSAGLIGAPLAGWLGAKIGKHRAVMLAAVTYALALLSYLVVPKGSVVASLPTNFIFGFATVGFTALTRAMVADIADEVRLEQGKERSALLFALTTLSTKIASTISIILTFPLLAYVGYDPKLAAANTPAAITGLTWIFLVGPFVLMVAGACSMIGYKLTAEQAAANRRLLEERDAGLAARDALGRSHVQST